tara:strand:+ start:100 stop:1938 length:1839 start_codon:yes stop_codon:yes gene_type:complete
MAKTPTLTSGLTVSSPGVSSTPTSQMGLLGSLLERIGVKPLAQQLAEEQAQKNRAILSQDLDTQKGQTQLSQLGLGPISFSDDVQNFINQDAINKQRIAEKEKELASKSLSNVEGASTVDSAQLGDKSAGIDQDVSGLGADKKTELDDQFEIAAGSDADIDYSDVGEPGSLAPEEEATPETTLAKEQKALQNLFTETMAETEELYSDEITKAQPKSIEEYKADFQKATGIDITGEPDNKSALMALGLKLMQNRAGKGFDLSKILTEVGRAGEETLPAFERAKDKARAGQLAAGKFALGQKMADTKALAALNKEKRLALLSLGKEFRGKAEARRLAAAKHLNAVELKELEFTEKKLLEYQKGKAKLSEITKNQGFAPIDGQSGLKIQKALRKDASVGNPLVYTQAPDDIRRFKDAYGNITRARNTLSSISGLVQDLGSDTGSPLVDQVFTKVKNIGVAIGLDPKKLFKDLVTVDKNGEAQLVKGVGRDRLISILNRTLINEYKRFLTQETGNGISNKDVDLLRESLGEVDLFANPQESLQRINEIDQIFAKTQDQITNTLTGFKDRNSYLTDDQFERAQKELKAGTVEQFGKSGPKFNVSTADDGTLTYTLVK